MFPFMEEYHLLGEFVGSDIESAHQSLFDRDAHIGFHYEDPSAIASSSSGPSLRSKSHGTEHANVITPLSSDNLSSLEPWLNPLILVIMSPLQCSFWHAERLARSSKKNPSFTSCCANGKIQLPAAPNTPQFLDDLLNPDKGSLSVKFRHNIRAYNSMFAFTSMGAHIDHTVNSQPGPYIFKINGQCHHLMGSLLPIDAESPRFAQLYIFDTDNEIANRLHPFNNDNCQSSLDENVVKKLIDMLDCSNALVKSSVRHRLNNDEFPNFKLRLIGKRDGDSKQYDDPSSNDVCGLIVGDIGESQTDRDIIIESYSRNLRRISKLHPKFMSLQYPLLFPYGEDGYHTDILFTNQEHYTPSKRQKVTMIAYYAYVIQERLGDSSTLTKGGRLYQQFLVDAFMNVEQERLDFIRSNQENLRILKDSPLGKQLLGLHLICSSVVAQLTQGLRFLLL
uniref:Helitron helicase-like domain-containing protein n=1 Tax=Salix viminalis TaxID=40686 RepID=A0A6N2KG64_SALVM